MSWTTMRGSHVLVSIKENGSHTRADIIWTGQDNTSNECIVGDVSNIFDGSESDHDGPYDGVEMGC